MIAFDSGLRDSSTLLKLAIPTLSLLLPFMPSENIKEDEKNVCLKKF